MIEKLGRLDSRILYGILLLSFIIPLLWPLGLPMIVSEGTKNLYNRIDELPAGAAVVMSFDIGAGSYDELSPAAEAVLNHLAQKDIRMIGMSFWEMGGSLFEKTLSETSYMEKEYGTDYVNLGFLTGGENAMSSTARDIVGNFAKDINGLATKDMAIFKGIETFNDVELVIVLATGTPGIPEWIRQVGDPMGVPIFTLVIAGLVADYAPYMQSKQLSGMLPGLRGAAGYETLTGTLGRGTSGLDAQSVAHIVILLFVLLGNVVYFFERKKRLEGEGETV